MAALLIAGCNTPSPPTAPSPSPPIPASSDAPPPSPSLRDGATGLTAKPGWSARKFAVAAANPLAAEAGAQMLREGGAAIDAAVAVQMVLTLVEPQSSGIGGGAFLLHWDGTTVQAWDGRETAPAAADERLFMRPDGKPMLGAEAAVGGRSVGVLGAVRMLEAAHQRHGRLPWARLFAPAIALAEQGFAVSHRLHTQLGSETHLRSLPRAAHYFYRSDGQPHPVGHRLRNPALAAVLKAIAARGSQALHEGTIANDIVAQVQGHATNPGRVTAADLASYRPQQREPICTLWKTIYRVCGMPPPSSGHLAVMQILGLLEHAPQPTAVDASGLPSAAWLHSYTEASRLAFADRARYVADPAFVEAPGGDWRSLLAPDYLRQRATLIGERSMNTAQPGVPGAQRVAYGLPNDQAEHGTSHVSIVDGHGQALAMTTTIEAVWGSRLMSDGGTGLPGGFLLNNQLTDFSALPTDAQGRLIANRVQPGKRPRSSMSPTLVFDAGDGRLLMSLGSPGGPAIIHFVAKTLIGSLDWGLNAQQAIDLPNFGSFNGPTVLEEKRFPAATVETLKGRGHAVVLTDLTSGLQALQRTPSGWFGGADPRREGVVVGE